MLVIFCLVAQARLADLLIVLCAVVLLTAWPTCVNLDKSKSEQLKKPPKTWAGKVVGGSRSLWQFCFFRGLVRVVFKNFLYLLSFLILAHSLTS
jgi:hypothetical protein